jgi:(S)-2-hydroxy-acid oxidase
MKSQWLPETRKRTDSTTADDPAISSTTTSTNEGLVDYRAACLNVNDFQRVAKELLPKQLYEYLASGTDDEQTLSENQMAFKRWYLRPRVMRPVGNISTRTTLFGHSVSMPVFCSPAGVHALCDPQNGECATARAAAKAGILFGLSQHSTRSIEEVAAVTPSGLRWYQAYILKDRSRTLSLIRRAIKAGYQGIFVTVDSVRFGYREADARNNFNALPPPHRLVNYDEDDANQNPNGGTGKLDQTYNSQQERAWDQNSEQMFEQNVSWDDIAWLKREAAPDVPLMIKGIMTGEDAKMAVAAGADGVMVSNHGGRQLDGCQATIDVLPEVVDAVDGRVPVWLDSGVRRGTDILKALSLGASAVGIGKPFFFALAIGGEDAVTYLLQLLQTELEAAMAICGMERVQDISSHLVIRNPAATFAPDPTDQIGTRLSRL